MQTGMAVGPGMRWPVFSGKPQKPDEALFSRLRSSPSLKARQKAFQQLKQQLGLTYTPKEKLALDETLAQAGALSRQPLNAVIRSLERRGYVLLFADDLILPGKQARQVLGAFEYDAEDIRFYEREVREDQDYLTAAELLEERKEYACFIPVKEGRPKGYFLFSSPRRKNNKANFYHELVHALQHENGLYQKPLYRSDRDFLKRELEASGFVIENAGLLGIRPADLKMEMRVWSLRAKEWLQAAGGKFSLIV